MKISLIGMSGSGKSYWSKRLEKKGFRRFGCDNLIEKKLGKELTKLGYKGIADVAKWMGYPFEKQYSGASKKYLDFEKQVLREILLFLKTEAKADENIVIDTTGSVIYTGSSILKELSQLTQIVYLKIPESGVREMYKLFLKSPKPVIWGNTFSRINGETEMEALKRCYIDLLASRAKQYENLSQKGIDCSPGHRNSYTTGSFLDTITAVPNSYHDQVSQYSRR